MTEGRTVAVIAPSTADGPAADCIWVLDRGAVAEAGTHGELAEAGGPAGDAVGSTDRPGS